MNLCSCCRDDYRPVTEVTSETALIGAEAKGREESVKSFMDVIKSPGAGRGNIVAQPFYIVQQISKAPKTPTADGKKCRIELAGMTYDGLKVHTFELVKTRVEMQLYEIEFSTTDVSGDTEKAKLLGTLPNFKFKYFK